MKTYTESDLRDALATMADTDPKPVDVWPPLRARIARRRRRRVGALVTVAAAATAAAVVGWPHASSRDSIGPAHDGSTVVTLTPDRPLTSAEMTTTAEILRHRFDAAGVSGTITTHDDRIEISVATKDAGLVERFGVRGDLQWRQILAVKPARGTLSGTGPAGTADDLADAKKIFRRTGCQAPKDAPNKEAAASSYLVACSADGSSEYLLAPASIGNRDIATANPQHDSTTAQWLVVVSLTDRGSTGWQQLTARAAQQPEAPHCGPPAGCNGIGIVIDGQVLAAPSVLSSPRGITGGMTQIAGLDSRDQARALAAEISADPLPAPMTSGGQPAP